MLRTRRSSALLALCLTLSPSLAGCVATRHIPFDERADMNGITGVTMRSGAHVPFSVPGGQVTNDTLYGIGRKGQLLLPVDSVASVLKPERSTGRTVGLAFVLLGVAVVAAGIAASSVPFIGSP